MTQPKITKFIMATDKKDSLHKEQQNYGGYQLPKASEEQLRCIQDIIEEKNLVINAVAGSGKTTTILHIASALHSDPQNSKKILLLTYNSRLKEECRSKVLSLGLEKTIEVHSFHAFCNKYYRECQDDFVLQNLWDNPDEYPPKGSADPSIRKKFSFLILDEMQDMNLLYYKFTLKIIDDYFSLQSLQFACIGDPKQSIFKFNNADTTYLLKASDNYTILGGCQRQWVYRTLTTSYRLTPSLANFMNHVVLGENLIHGGNQNSRQTSVTYLVCDPFKQKVVNYITQFLGKQNYKPDDFFILAPSLRNEKTPARQTENQLVQMGIPCYVASDEQSRQDTDLMKGKIVFGTFHSVKGLERKIVIVFGVDDSYFTFFAKDEKPDECPNTMYVAMTRASEHLIVVQSSKHNPTKFVDVSKLQQYSNYVTVEKAKKKAVAPPLKRARSLEVTQLVRHKPVQTLVQAQKLLKYKTLREPQPLPGNLSVNYKIQTTKGLFEDVSGLYGTMIPAWFMYKKTGTSAVFDTLQKSKPELLESFRKIPIESQNSRMQKMMELCNHYLVLVDGYLHKTAQIRTYDFVQTEFIQHAIDNLQRQLHKKEYQEEISASLTGFDEQKGVRWTVKGRMDLIEMDTNQIWELKCTAKLEVEHILQTALYLVLYPRAQCANLYNCVTHEWIQIERPTDDAVLQLLLAV
jgi:ATP-dependent exoDNAse (exonuclease V) beta subunit